MALTPASLMEQQRQPLPSSSHSSEVVESWEMVRGFGSMEVESPNSEEDC